MNRYLTKRQREQRRAARRLNLDLLRYPLAQRFWAVLVEPQKVTALRSELRAVRKGEQLPT